MLSAYEATLKAAADPNRVRILKMLEGGELCVCQVVAALNLSQSTVSKHLTVLRQAGLIDERKISRWVHVRLAEAPANEYARALLALARGWLNKDPLVKAAAERVKRIRKTPVTALCCPNPGEALDRIIAGAAGARAHG
jgi:ArsR family transcriptional regulator, arsenate/arsenite/antimonite-responsive transcriptional repressor